MANDPIQTGKNQWLWILIFASMALLIVIWLVDTWRVESDVQPGASADGLTYPAGGGITIDAPAAADKAAPDAAAEPAKTE